MTNTKFRRRALLSSVAMLLVAMLALGSATFAWYAANTTADASGLTFTTTGEAGLVIATQSEHDADSTWHWKRTGATFGNLNTTAGADVLKPASLNPVDGSFYKTASSNATTDAAAAGAAVSTISAPYVYDKVYFKLEDTGSAPAAGTTDVFVSGITISGQTTDNKAKDMVNAIRVAFYTLDGSTLLYTDTIRTDSEANTLADKQNYVAEFAATGNSSASYLKSTGTYDSSTSLGTKNVKQASAANFDTGVDANAGGTVGVMVVAYLDGFGTNVNSDNATAISGYEGALKNILTSLEISFTMQ